jgi:hypothetical protein
MTIACKLLSNGLKIASLSWPGDSRPKDGVASARLCPAIHVFLAHLKKDVDARHNGPVLGPAKPDPSAGHDEFFQ